MRWFSKKMAHSSNNGARVPLTHICNEFQSDRAERESLYTLCITNYYTSNSTEVDKSPSITQWAI